MEKNKGLMEASIKLFNEMKQNNIPTDAFTYNILINMFEDKGLIDDSIKLFNELVQLLIFIYILDIIIFINLITYSLR